MRKPWEMEGHKGILRMYVHMYVHLYEYIPYRIVILIPES
jgi:hypothetical protein